MYYKIKKFIKNKVSIIFTTLFVLGYILLQFDTYHNVAPRALGNLGNSMKQVPWSFVYVIICIIILYFTGRIPFFKGMQIGKNSPFLKDKKSTKHEIFATIAFGIIVILMTIGFFIIMLN